MTATAVAEQAGDGPLAWSALRPWVPARTAWCWRAMAEAGAPIEALHPSEAVAVERAVARRRQEFAWGRWCARQAMQQLGMPVVALPVGPSRAPVWPPGVVGAISHDGHWCVAGAARAQDWRGLGVDVEAHGRVLPEMAPLLASPAERLRLGAVTDAAQRQRLLARLFAAKEAAFKALHPVDGAWMDFQDAEFVVWPEATTSSFQLQLRRDIGAWQAGQRFEGAVAEDSAQVVALLALPAA